VGVRKEKRVLFSEFSVFSGLYMKESAQSLPMPERSSGSAQAGA